MDFVAIFESPIFQIILVIAIAGVTHSFSGRVIHFAIGRVLSRIKDEQSTPTDRKKRQKTLSSILTAAVAIVVWIVAIGFILSILEFDLAQVAAGAGFLGIIVGLGAQATIKDYLAGIFILFENQYRVGDIVTLGVNGETSGVVEDITLRITKLRDLEGNLHIVRNGEAVVITNRTFRYASVVIDVGVAYDSDITAVERAMNRVGKGMLKDQELVESIIEPIQFLRVDAFADSAVMVKALGKVKPAEQWTIAGEYRRRLLEEFQSNDIEIPFPQVTVHNPKK